MLKTNPTVPFIGELFFQCCFYFPQLSSFTRYDPDGKGYIDHQHFLYMMGKAFAPGDESGTSKRIVEDSYNAISAHHQNQLEKQ